MLTIQQANSSRISGASQFHRIKIILYYEYHVNNLSSALFPSIAAIDYCLDITM